MNREDEPNSLPEPQATVWPPPPNSPFVTPAADPQPQQIAAITDCVRSAALLFVAGCIAPIVSWAVFGLLLKMTPGAAKLGSAGAWVVLYAFAVYYGSKASLLAHRAHRPGLLLQALIILALSLLCSGIWFRLYL